MSANKETFGKTVGVVVAVCLACSIVVSSAAVGLRSSAANQCCELDKQTNIIEAAGLTETAAGDIAGAYEKYVEERFVNLETGEYVDAPYSGYDMIKAARMPEYSVRVEGSNVGFQTRAKSR